MLKKNLLIGFALFIFGASAFASTTPNSFVSPQTPNRGIVRFLQGTDSPGTFKTLYTSGANGSRCYGIWSFNNDPSATHAMTVAIFNSATNYGGPTFTTVLYVAAATLTQNVMTNWVGLPVDEYGNSYVQLISGDTIQVTYATALTSTDAISLVASCSDF